MYSDSDDSVIQTPSGDEGVLDFADRIIDNRKPSPEALAIDSHIAELKAQLEVWRIKQELELASRSLIARVPDEILQRVLIFSIKDKPSMMARVSLVSRLWQRLVTVTPALHTSIDYTNYHIKRRRPYDRLRTSCEHIPQLLERSQEAPLSVRLTVRSPPHFEDGENPLHRFVEHFSSHLGRVTIFHMYADDPTWIQSFTAQPDARLGPGLQELSLVVTHHFFDLVSLDGQAVPSDTLIPILTKAETYKSLRKLVAEGLLLPQIMDLSMPHLRSLHFGSSSRNMYLEICQWRLFMHGVPELEELLLKNAYFQCDESCVEDHLDLQPIDMPALKSVSLLDLHGQALNVLFAMWSLPALERLFTDCGDIYWLTAALGHASCPCLQGLYIPNILTCGLNLIPFVRLLRRVPNLTTLGIRALCMPVAGASMETSTNSWLLPRLNTLVVCGDLREREQAADGIIRVINARRTAARTHPSGTSYSVISSETPAHIVDKITCVGVDQLTSLEEFTSRNIGDVHFYQVDHEMNVAQPLR